MLKKAPVGKRKKLSRPRSPQVDQVLGRQFPVLDHGFVRVVDYMGSDASIVQAARVSYGAGTKSVSKDAALIRYLMRHRHTSPFEMCEIKLHIRVPMDCWRQWIRHRTANVNEYSTRYSEAIAEAAKTKTNAWRTQAAIAKQGSGGLLREQLGARLSEREEALQRLAREVYEERLHEGVAREQARKDLPLSTYTEAYWKIDLHNLFNFLSLRMDAAAQLEIREYATVIGSEIVRRWCPSAWKAFCDYRLKSVTLSAREVQVAGFISGGDPDAARRAATDFGWLGKVGEKASAEGERREAEAKLKLLGLTFPWSTPPTK